MFCERLPGMASSHAMVKQFLVELAAGGSEFCSLCSPEHFADVAHEERLSGKSSYLHRRRLSWKKVSTQEERVLCTCFGTMWRYSIVNTYMILYDYYIVIYMYIHYIYIYLY